MINVLYICHDYEQMGGAALSLANLLDSVKEQVNPVLLLRHKGAVADFFRERGYHVLIHDYALNISGNNLWFRITTYIPRWFRDKSINRKCTDYVISQLKGKKIDVVHTNSSVISYGVDLAKILKAKHVWHVREYYSVGLNKTPIEGFPCLRKKMRDADAVVCITKEVEKHWQMEGHDKAYVISDAVRSKNDTAWNEEKEKSVVFCSATLIPSKGTEEAVRIFCKSGISRKGYRLNLIGKCQEDYKQTLLEAARKYSDEDNLEFLGFKSDIKPILEKASVFLMCSKFEGLGRVTIEAMFYGCPVLAYNSGGTRSIIIDGENGVMYETVDDAAEKLRKLTEDRTFAQQLAIIAQKDAIVNFSNEEYGKKMTELYKRILR